MAITLTGNAGVTTNSGAVYDGLQRGTAVTASGTSVDFTGIPSWVKRITVMFDSVSTNGTTNSTFLIQIGNSGGIETSNYQGYSYNAASDAFNSYSNGFGVSTYNSPQANGFSGHLVILNILSNTWIATGIFAGTTTVASSVVGGTKSLSDVLDRVRITTPNGTDTFDAGTNNIIYE